MNYLHQLRPGASFTLVDKENPCIFDYYFLTKIEYNLHIYSIHTYHLLSTKGNWITKSEDIDSLDNNLIKVFNVDGLIPQFSKTNNINKIDWSLFPAFIVRDYRFLAKDSATNGWYFFKNRPTLYKRFGEIIWNTDDNHNYYLSSILFNRLILPSDMIDYMKSVKPEDSLSENNCGL